MTGAGRLPVSDDDLAGCVSCGLCLPSCPTYRVTGEESASPRGRIAAMREVHAGAVMGPSFTRFMDLCVQCRACEVACPSAVPFGRLMEGARQALVLEAGYQPWWRRVGYWVLGHHRLLLVLTSATAIAQRCRILPRGLVGRFALPRLPVRQPRLVASCLEPNSRPPAARAGEAADGVTDTRGVADTDGAVDTHGVDDMVWLFTGCVMDAWQRHVHVASQTVIEATGAVVALPGPGGDCCGALHRHAGLSTQAIRLTTRVMASMAGQGPIIVDSAGCGAALKDYGHLLATPEAVDFSARVFDIHEWLAGRLDRLPTSPAERTGHRPGDAAGQTRRPVAIQDPCHLRHVQRSHGSVRSVLAPFVETVEPDDDGMCCGAGGAYSAQHPEMAGLIRDRKLAAIARTGAAVVASANPGCSMWLAAAGVEVRHPMELIAAALAAEDGRVGGGR